MKHYWVLGLLGVGFYGMYQYSQQGLWFQHPSVVEQSVDAAKSGDFHWTGKIGSGDAIEIKGVNGSVSARSHGGNQVIVRASKRSRRSDLSTVRLEVVEHSQGVTICALYPARRGNDSHCAPGDGASLGGGNNDVNVDFEIQVPEGVTFIANTLNGSVRAVEMRGPIEARTVNGEIELSTTGLVMAETVNGDIAASLADDKLTADISLQTVNGSVRLALPANIDADILGGTSNGQVHSDFPLTIQGRFGPKQFRGVIGGGGEEIRLESVNGGIWVVKTGR